MAREFLFENIMKNKDLLKELKSKVEDYFGISVAIIYDYETVYEKSEDLEYCRYLRADFLNKRKCEVDVMMSEIKALTKNSPVVFTCHAGLINFAIPVMIKEEVVGILLCGTFRTADETEVFAERLNTEVTQLAKNSKVLKFYESIEVIEKDTLDVLVNAVDKMVLDVTMGTFSDDLPFRLVGDTKIKRSINKSLEYVYCNIYKNITLDEAAEIAGLSSFYFCKSFKKIMGVGFAQYVRAAKIESAKKILKDERIKISEVSTMLGFNENNYFARVFREVTGMTPREYRKSFKIDTL